MSRRTWLLGLSLACILLVPRPGSAGAAAKPRLLVVACAPGYPGTSAEAQAAMDAFAAALAKAAGWEPGSAGAVYEPTEKGGLQRIPEASVAIVTLPFLLAHEGALHLEPSVQIETLGGKTSETWALVAKKGRITKPADLAGFTVASIAGYAPDFVRGALGPWGRLPAGVQIVETKQVLSVLRKSADGAPQAALLDGDQTAALATLPFAAQLEVVARSQPMPAGVVALGGRLTAPERRAVEKALLTLHEDPAGKAALAGIRAARFLPVDAAALAAARKIATGAGE